MYNSELLQKKIWIDYRVVNIELLLGLIYRKFLAIKGTMVLMKIRRWYRFVRDFEVDWVAVGINGVRQYSSILSGAQICRILYLNQMNSLRVIKVAVNACTCTRYIHTF